MEQEDKNLHAQQPDEAQTPAKQPEPKGYEAYLSLFDLVRMLAVITLMFVFFFRVNGVSGSSMYPTLVDKDYLVLESNFLYRNARQGDIVVLYTPPFSDNDELLVKRVIAVGGQTVDIDFNAGIVYVDGQALDERYTFEPTYLSYAEYGKALDYPVTVPEGADGYDLLQLAGKKRGYLVSGGEVNTERMAKALMDDYRSGKLGKLTLESPEEQNA